MLQAIKYLAFVVTFVIGYVQSAPTRGGLDLAIESKLTSSLPSLISLISFEVVIVPENGAKPQDRFTVRYFVDKLEVIAGIIVDSNGNFQFLSTASDSLKLGNRSDKNDKNFGIVEATGWGRDLFLKNGIKIRAEFERKDAYIELKLTASCPDKGIELTLGRYKDIPAIQGKLEMSVVSQHINPKKSDNIRMAIFRSPQYINSATLQPNLITTATFESNIMQVWPNSQSKRPVTSATPLKGDYHFNCDLVNTVNGATLSTSRDGRSDRVIPQASLPSSSAGGIPTSTMRAWPAVYHPASSTRYHPYGSDVPGPSGLSGQPSTSRGSPSRRTCPSSPKNDEGGLWVPKEEREFFSRCMKRSKMIKDYPQLDEEGWKKVRKEFPGRSEKELMAKWDALRDKYLPSVSWGSKEEREFFNICMNMQTW